MPSFRKSRVRVPLDAASLVLGCPHFHYTSGAAGDTALCSVGVTEYQLELESLTILSVAGCGRLQLGAAHWPTSAALLQVYLIIDSSFSGSSHWVAHSHRRLNFNLHLN